MEFSKSPYHEGLEETELKQERIKAQQAIKQASEEYHQTYLDRHCNIKVLPGLMKEPMPLDTIYTAVQFLGDLALEHFLTLDDIEELYRTAGKRRFRVGEDERRNGLEVANEKQYLMVLGGPGAGKSTFLRKLGLTALEGNLNYDKMPVFIELKSFKSEEMTLQQAIARELKTSRFPYAESLVKSMLAEGKLLILLDGLDEVPSNQVDRVIDQIKDFCDQHRQNRFVASCRIAAYRKGGFNRFTDVTMAEFDDEQIEQFVRRWFSSTLDLESGTAERFWELIKQPENAAAKELAQTPLLLTFLCLVYDRSQSLPTVRSTLYGDALDILLKDWAAEKRIKQDPIYQGFHADLEKVLLSEIAYESFKKDQLFFSEQEIVGRITAFLSDTLDAPKHLDGAAVLKAIEVQQGVLVERAANVYSFSHLTLQEYLTARYISKRSLIQELVSEHLTDKRWREVFLLVSGLLEERSQELWLAMEQQAGLYTQEPKLRGLLYWTVALIDDSQPSNKVLASRSLLLQAFSAIAIAITGYSAIDIADVMAKTRDIAVYIARTSDSDRDSAIDRAIARGSSVAVPITGTSNSDRDRAIDIAITIASAIIRTRVGNSDNDSDSDIDIAIAQNMAKNIARDIARTRASNYDTLSKKLEKLKEQIPAKQAPSADWQNFANQLMVLYLSFFHLDRELVTLSFEEAQAIEKYFYTVKLLIDCKNSAVRVSRQQWLAIESRLLTPQ